MSAHDEPRTHANLHELTIQKYQANLRGKLLRPGDEEYEKARRVWNGMIDRRPALIAQCADVADVMTSVNFARDNGLVVAVRGGSHNVTGNAVSDGGLTIDLSR
jgi:FAD/FMN-containing dehydrogenase